MDLKQHENKAITLKGHRESLSSGSVSLDKQSDALTDIWSLGIIIYELYTKKKPYQGNTETS